MNSYFKYLCRLIICCKLHDEFKLIFNNTNQIMFLHTEIFLAIAPFLGRKILFLQFVPINYIMKKKKKGK